MRTLVAVSALINRGDDYLFIKQNKVGGAYPDTLHLPGGRIEPDENPLEAVAREIEEEVLWMNKSDLPTANLNLPTLKLLSNLGIS